MQEMTSAILDRSRPGFFWFLLFFLFLKAYSYSHFICPQHVGGAAVCIHRCLTYCTGINGILGNYLPIHLL
ncbi:uncharacterized protein GGS25DRAFT_511139 [Hypoxylon fragiforme]|uniref:uncharacterized protein n=1 Tax=Hypoxylon fragiforme TaxID=63214 RepID=UPI0020C60765|nr:uncharacterized protein GGS25DRAFT_511139 [Hypoxylon fragiforme]KAI2603387.1 hypothetical protein GGS25DRAFT_511139 [Hypoxylon fragiforme]